jgi:hypothetical protein
MTLPAGWGELRRWALPAPLGGAPLDERLLGPPIPAHSQTFASVANHGDRAAEISTDLPASPLVLTRYWTCAVGTFDEARLPSGRVDWKVGLVIATRTRAERVRGGRVDPHGRAHRGTGSAASTQTVPALLSRKVVATFGSSARSPSSAKNSGLRRTVRHLSPRSGRSADEQDKPEGLLRRLPHCHDLPGRVPPSRRPQVHRDAGRRGVLTRPANVPRGATSSSAAWRVSAVMRNPCVPRPDTPPAASQR